MERVLRRGLMLLLMLLMVSGFAHAATYTEDVEFTFPATDVLHLAIDGSNGNISFRPVQGSDIHVTATKRVTAWSQGRARDVADRIRIDLQHTQNTGTVRIDVSLAPNQWLVSQGVAIEVLVPADWLGTVELSTSNGSIHAESINGDVRLETSNGTITVDGHAGRLYARTSNGRLELRNLDTNLYARTSNGRVGVYNAVLRGAGEVRTSNGSVTFESTLKEDADYSVRTSNGSITLQLRKPISVALDLATSNGSVQLDGVDVLASDISRTSLRGTIGSGEASLEARTSNGSITVSAR